ncbi:NADP-dependent oxidoreductase [Brackiella oedipodis]|uniref:NADP-dependent oxidoreductase n=1 Tax=Brackiella oedipodis TaxID=124225 RepID=UPI00049159BB|nr:NADP-dependent oxidoreductase [Brackiella oedipodis]
MTASIKNHQWRLKSRPEGRPTEENFDWVEESVPDIKDNEILLKVYYLSLDPYMRGRMSAAESYADPVPVGGLMSGGTVCKVLKSNLDKFKEGDWVLSYSGWQEYAVSDGKGVTKLPDDIPKPSYALGILGMPGFTGYMGLTDIGQPQAGETVVVAAATGPVGSTVGQVAKIKGARAIGIAGGPEKCRYAVEKFGFDECIDHHADDFKEQLAKVCDKGIDVYYENVGGKVFEAVFDLLNPRARIPLCGLVSSYNNTKDSPPSIHLNADQLMRKILTKRLTIEGFIVFNEYREHYPAFIKQMSQWIKEDKIHVLEQVVEGGLQKAPEAFQGLLEGKNFGKIVVQVAKD